MSPKNPATIFLALLVTPNVLIAASSRAPSMILTVFEFIAAFISPPESV